MGSVARRIKKSVRKATKFLDKKVVEPFIEKPIKKIGKETFDTVMGTTDEERRAILSGDMPTPEPAVTPEITPEVVPDETIVGRGRKRTKRPGGAGTIMEEYGVMTAKAKAKAVERA
tara:strand:+ start:30 stop:380 length:351 start_codon:yes stop_codon:yes gene_type:complete